MFVKVNYFGFYPLGADIKINNIEIMKSQWNVYKRSIITWGKKNIVSPFMQDLFYVTTKKDSIFFVAIEWGLGHYHIFTVNEQQSKKLSKKIGAQTHIYNPTALYINKTSNGVRIYGRVVSGARDMNFQTEDSIFRLIDTETFTDFTRYTFTNSGDDRFYLDVYSPGMVDNSELSISIDKAEKIIWHWISPEIGEVSQEYRLLDTYVELTRNCLGNKEILYFY